jgi:hypothetical protein
MENQTMGKEKQNTENWKDEQHGHHQTPSFAKVLSMILERKQIYIKRERIYNLGDVNRRHFAAMIST